MAGSAEWMSIVPGALEELPERPGVFVVGSLVRNVLFVGSASEGIRAAVRAALDRPDLRGQARCIKIEPSDDPAQRLAEILTAYRDAHAGALPPAQPAADQDRARSQRLGAVPRPGPGRYAGPGSPLVPLAIRTVA